MERVNNPTMIVSQSALQSALPLKPQLGTEFLILCWLFRPVAHLKGAQSTVK